MKFEDKFYQVNYISLRNIYNALRKASLCVDVKYED